VTRIAAGIFVLFYAAWESVAGLAVGALVQHTNGLPGNERAVASDAIESLIDNVIVGNGGLLAIVGGLAWIVAVIAAAVAVRGAGASLAAALLLGLSAIIAQHPPPFGPLGLAFFAGAVVLLYRSERVRKSTRAQPESPVPTPGATA
jgi:Ca2+/Na+ antiporter